MTSDVDIDSNLSVSGNINVGKDVIIGGQIENKNYTFGADNYNNFIVKNNEQGNYWSFQSDANFCEYWPDFPSGTSRCTMCFSFKLINLKSTFIFNGPR